MAKQKKPCIAARAEDGTPVVEIFAFEFNDGKLVMDCKALGSMRMDVIIEPDSIGDGWPVIMRDKKAVIQFAKLLPKAIRSAKKKAKAASDQAAQ